MVALRETERGMKTLAIIQARMTSTRLPGKVLLDLAGKPMLVRVLNRVRRARTLTDTVVATSTESADDPIARLCAARNWPCVRGSCDDVLDRFYQAARQHQADVIVRITSDCPLIESAIIDLVVTRFLVQEPVDYASNNSLLPLTFPRGLDVEVMSFAALQDAWQNDHDPASREHVTPYLYHHPEQFRLAGVFHHRDLSHLRWTVDTPDDLILVRKVYEFFGDDCFNWYQVLDLLEQHPEWLSINRHVRQKAI